MEFSRENESDDWRGALLFQYCLAMRSLIITIIVILLTSSSSYGGLVRRSAILSPIGPEVGGDVGVEVGVAVVQGECEGEEEPAETGENPLSVVKYFHCFVLTHCLTVFT